MFEDHYRGYLEQIRELIIVFIARVLGLKRIGEDFFIPFFDRKYRRITENDFLDSNGECPLYMICVVLAKCLLLFPDRIREDNSWVSFRDFKQISHFTNINYSKSATE